MAHVVHNHTGATTLIGNCWSHINMRGDQFCPRLAMYSHYLNCSVSEEGVAALLDRVLSDADLEAVAQAHRTVASLRTLKHASTELAVLVFRVTDEWLALPTVALRQIDTPRAIHTLSHRRNRVVLGLVNIRGALTVTVLLGELLGLGHTGGKYARRNGCAWLLMAAHHDGPTVPPVDEMEDVLHFPATALLPVPSMLARAITAYARDVLAWRDVTIGLLDANRIFGSIARSL